MEQIGKQSWLYRAFYIVFAVVSTTLLLFYLSDTLIHFTTPYQFPINSFERFPLTVLIFPAELFSMLFGLYFVYVLLNDQDTEPSGTVSDVDVAILVPVYNEPKDIVDRTLEQARQVRWSGDVKIYLLDDSDEKEHMDAMDGLAAKHGCEVVRRDARDGFKAGNVNNAVKTAVDEPFFVILDADQAPQPQLLEETMDYFAGDSIAYVQTPQYYVNDESRLARTAKIMANIFFHAMCRGRNHDGATIFCGTNAVLRTAAFREVNGFAYYTATEDIDLGVRLKNAGYSAEYVPTILVHGHAPEDYGSYASQQYRWANGNLAILRERWKEILGGRLSMRQKVHTVAVLGWWLIGLITLVFILVPLISLVTQSGTHHTWLPDVVMVLLYLNIVFGILMMYVALQQRVEDSTSLWDAVLAYSLLINSSFIYVRAALNALFKRYVGFVRTDKKESIAKLGRIKWNLLFGTVCVGAAIYGIVQAGRYSMARQVRTYLPISGWLIFYGTVLYSSILFVGDDA